MNVISWFNVAHSQNSWDAFLGNLFRVNELRTHYIKHIFALVADSLDVCQLA